MKKSILLTVVLLFSSILAISVQAETYSGIIRDGSNWIYTQNSSTFDSIHAGIYSLRGYGCRIFSLAHAAMWLNGTKYDTSLFKDLAAQVHASNSPMDTSNTAFQNVLKQKNVIMKKHSEVVRDFSEDSIRTAFCDGWVFQINTVDHFTLAVDYIYGKPSNQNNNEIIPVVDDGKNCPEGCTMYVQILDSEANASTKSGRSFGGGKFYILNDGVLSMQSGTLPQKGLQYWVDYNTFIKFEKRPNYDVALHGAWHGHNINKYANYLTISTSQNGFYRLISGNGNLKEYPYAGTKTMTKINTNVAISSLTNNDVLEVSQIVANSYEAEDPGNHQWAELYQLSNKKQRCFAFFSDLEFLYKKQCDVYQPIVCMQNDIKLFPFADAKNVRENTEGSKLFIVAQYKNKYGKIWYGVADTSGGTQIGYVNINNIQIDNSRRIIYADNYSGLVPTGTLPKGKAKTLGGIIHTNESIYKVSAEVVSHKTQKVVASSSCWPSANTMDIDINKYYNGHNIDRELSFEKLPEDYYTYQVCVTFGYMIDKTPCIGDTYYLPELTSNFQIGNPSGSDPLPDIVTPIISPYILSPDSILSFNNIKYPSQYPVNKTNGYYFNEGTITAKDGLSSVTFSVYGVKGNQISTYTENLNGVTSYPVKNADSHILFSKLTDIGNCAIFEVTATDTRGRTLSAGPYISVVSSGSTIKENYINRTYIDCPQLAGSTTYNNHEYEIYNASYTWEQANEFAASKGGHLVCISSSEENSVVNNLQMSVSGATRVWIGLYRSNVNSSIQWTNGEAVSFTAWEASEPSSYANLNYTAIKDNGKWVLSNNSSNTYKHFIVEYEPIACPHTDVTRNTIKEPNCTELGQWEETCNACNEVVNSGFIDSLDHDWGDWTVTTAATCTAEGVETRVCSRDSSHTETRTIDRLVPSGTCGDNLTWVLDYDTLTVSGTGMMYDYPKEGTPWYQYHSDIIKVNIQTGVTYIGESSFYNSENLTTLTLNEVLECIGGGAFESCIKLNNVRIPNSCTSINWWAFGRCYSLDNISLPKTIKNIGSGALRETKVVSLDFSDYQALELIGDDCFDGAQIVKIVLPNTISTINGRTFEDCHQLREVYIPNSVTTIAQNAFLRAENVVIYCYNGSAAHQYAIENNIAYETVGCLHSSVTRTTLKEATCTEQGQWEERCNNCKEVVNSGKIPALGHDYGAWTVTTAATCTEKGVETRVCKHDNSHKETRDINALGHALVQHAAQAPTCTAIGWDAYESCSRCDYTTYKEKAALGHTPEWVVSKAATCSEEGLKEERCTRCNQVLKSKKIKKLDHTPGEWTETQAATYSKEGLIEKHCAKCNQLLENKAIPKLTVTYDFFIPSFVTVIEEEAFMGIPAKCIKLSENVKEIGAKAFANCKGLEAIYIPSTCKSIASNAFSDVTGLTIFGADGSYAEFYANKYGFDFVKAE